MKIGIDCHNLEEYRTGVGRYLANLLKYWSEYKDTEFVLYFKEQIPKDDFLKSSNFIKKILKNPFNIKSSALFYNFSLPIAAKKDKIDVLFLPFYIRPLFCSVPTITAIHDISFRAHPEWFEKIKMMVFRIFSGTAIKKSLAILTCSHYTKQEILKYYKKAKANEIFVVHLASDEKFKELSHINPQVKEKYGIKDKFIFYVGAIFNRRSVYQSIEAFNSIADKFSNYQFLIGGPNYTNPFIDIDRMIKEVNRNLKKEAIIHVDYVDEEDLVELYNSADLFVWPSSYEGFGLPPLEAMACGTPVLTTRMTSLNEILDIYPMAVDSPDDIEEMRNKMMLFLTNEELRNKAIGAGIKRAEDFSWEKTAKETLEIIKNETNKK
jgi:glycosyltransferase involved in cell wall biosynthesis